MGIARCLAPAKAIEDALVSNKAKEKVDTSFIEISTHEYQRTLNLLMV